MDRGHRDYSTVDKQNLYSHGANSIKQISVFGEQKERADIWSVHNEFVRPIVSDLSFVIVTNYHCSRH